jgi:hypothetical protein
LVLEHGCDQVLKTYFSRVGLLVLEAVVEEECVADCGGFANEQIGNYKDLHDHFGVVAEFRKD